MVKEYALEWIDGYRERLVKVSDAIWEYAELGLREFKSSRLLAGELERHGFRVEMGVAGMPTAFVATWGSGRPVIGILGEYDALPGLSQKVVPWREPLVPGAPGHGCGHNIHGASGMAAALAVKAAMEREGLGGTVKFFGCPAEENFSGKVFMVRDGVFEGVDAVLSHHPGDMNAATLKSSLAVNSARFHFYGRASHAGASPEEGRSALDAVQLMNIGVEFMREHLPQDARVHYVVERGGGQPNVVPEYARAWYYVRAPEREEVERIYSWVVDIARGAALMTQTRVEVEFLEGVYNLLPNRVLAELVVGNMREVGLPEYSEEDLRFAEEIAKTIPREVKVGQLRKSGRPGWERLVDKLIDDEVPDPWGEGTVMHGSTDVADVSWQAPTLEFSTAAWVLGTPAHSWQAVAQSAAGIGHKALIFASKVLAASALDLLTKPEILEKAKEEHKRRLAGRVYRSPLPPGHKPPLDAWEK
ncbi:M20 family metallopeptidase [Thermofilum pendens]|uniref:Amidohydrolase n=1 Tax=Thermofilum pendens (strain DSM 2475 / Hrk 5) TaxID=368408 RepID=A1RZW7_THEPD|nr:M20 family metallopeptidase [Thermofilum pendens]ABL78747.1 amidohydrolase [Thermofilum pendens Hrk 5]